MVNTLMAYWQMCVLDKVPEASIVHDPRIIWNTQSVVAAKSGNAVQSKTGHAFIKQIMREVDAVYGGEMSAHHYFRDFAYCDSGMIPWLLVIELISRTGKPLSELMADVLPHTRVQAKSIFDWRTPRHQSPK